VADDRALHARARGRGADDRAPHATAALGTAYACTHTVGGRAAGVGRRGALQLGRGEKKSDWAARGEQRLAGRGYQIGPSRERREMGEKWVGGLRRGAKRSTGDGRGVSYFLFSSKLLLNEYFTETKQTHKK
jgi:hypothetical protein